MMSSFIIKHLVKDVERLSARFTPWSAIHSLGTWKPRFNTVTARRRWHRRWFNPIALLRRSHLQCMQEWTNEMARISHEEHISLYICSYFTAQRIICSIDLMLLVLFFVRFTPPLPYRWVHRKRFVHNNMLSVRLWQGSPNNEQDVKCKCEILGSDESGCC